MCRYLQIKLVSNINKSTDTKSLVNLHSVPDFVFINITQVGFSVFLQTCELNSACLVQIIPKATG